MIRLVLIASLLVLSGCGETPTPVKPGGLEIRQPETLQLSYVPDAPQVQTLDTVTAQVDAEVPHSPIDDRLIVCVLFSTTNRDIVFRFREAGTHVIDNLGNIYNVTCDGGADVTSENKPLITFRMRTLVPPSVTGYNIVIPCNLPSAPFRLGFKRKK